MFSQELMQFFNKLDFNKEDKSIRLKMIKKLYGSGILETLNYFLIKRIMIESNFHRMYFLFISSFFLNLYGFLDSVIKTCFEIFKIFFKRRKDYASTNEIIIFESIGNWIGKIYNMGHTILNKKYFSLKNFSTIGLCNGTFYFQSCFLIFLIKIYSKVKNKIDFIEYESYTKKNSDDILNFLFCSKDLKLNIEMFNNTFFKRHISKNIYANKNSMSYFARSNNQLLYYYKNILSRHISGDIHINTNKFKLENRRMEKRCENFFSIFQKFSGSKSFKFWLNFSSIFDSFFFFNYANICIEKSSVFYFENFINTVYFLESNYNTVNFEKSFKNSFFFHLPLRSISKGQFLKIYFSSLKKFKDNRRLKRLISLLGNKFIFMQNENVESLNFKMGRYLSHKIFISVSKNDNIYSKNLNKTKNKFFYRTSFFRPTINF